MKAKYEADVYIYGQCKRKRISVETIDIGDWICYKRERERERERVDT